VHALYEIASGKKHCDRWFLVNWYNRHIASMSALVIIMSIGTKPTLNGRLLGVQQR